MLDKGNKKDIEDWIPNSLKIPITWLNVDFDDIFDILPINEFKISQKEYLTQGAYPVIDQGNELIGGYSNDVSKIIKNNSFLIVFGDHTRCFKLINFDFIPGADGIKVLKLKEDLDTKYFYYVCKTLRLPNRGYSRHFSFLRKSKIPLSSLNEQKRIVTKIEKLFSELDKGIENLKLAREQLKVYRQAVLKHAFEGKLTEKWREENKNYKYLSNCDNFSSLPSSWECVELGKVITESQNGISKRTGNAGKEVIVLRLADIDDYKLSKSSLRKIHCNNQEIIKYSLSKGDILIVRVNGSEELVGKFICYPHRKEVELFCDHFIRLKPKQYAINIYNNAA